MTTDHGLITIQIERDGQYLIIRPPCRELWAGAAPRPDPVQTRPPAPARRPLGREPGARPPIFSVPPQLANLDGAGRRDSGPRRPPAGSGREAVHWYPPLRGRR